MPDPRGFTRCDECEGEGWTWADCCGDCGNKDGCLSCVGSGLVPTDQLREVAARVIAAFHRPLRPDLEYEALSDIHRREADAVLRKVAEHLGDRE